MKTRIKKIVLLTAALMFLGTGVSFANELHHRPPGHAYGQGHPVWYKKHPWPKWRHQKHYVPRKIERHHRDYGHYQHGSGYDGSVVKFAVADENVAFKIVVRDY